MKMLTQALQSAPVPYGSRAFTLGKQRRERLIENLHLESASLRPATWTYPANMPAGRGDNLSAAVLAEATKRLDAHGGVRAAGADFGTVMNQAGDALNPRKPGAGPDFFFRVAQKPTALTGTLWNVCSVNALQYSFTKAKRAWMKSLHAWMTSAAPEKLLIEQPDGREIGLCKAGSSFWLTDRSPLELLADQKITVGTQEAAWAVLQELALPGFETPALRKEEQGLVAVEFPATCLVDLATTGQAWKPTAVDALNFKGYCFLPGRSADAHGLTWPLQKCLRRHDCRDGMPEYVHPRVSVPALAGGRRMVHLLGFLDATAEATWNSLTPP